MSKSYISAKLRKLVSDRTLNTQHPIANSPHQTAIAPSTPTKPYRLFPLIKQRSPLTTKTRSPKPQHQTDPKFKKELILVR
jgi:hypothetical protein